MMINGQQNFVFLLLCCCLMNYHYFARAHNEVDYNREGMRNLPEESTWIEICLQFSYSSNNFIALIIEIKLMLSRS